MADDVLDLLRMADPLRGREVPGPDSAHAAAVLEAIMADPGAPVARTHRPRRVLIGLAAATVAVVAAAVVTTRPVTDPTVVGCYADASTAADTTVIGATSGDPVAQCRQLWTSGAIDPSGGDARPAPNLVACVLDRGAVGVFPARSCDEVARAGAAFPDDTASGPDATSTAGLPLSEGLPMPDFGPRTAAVRDAVDEIVRQIGGRCVSGRQATAVARNVLDQFGLNDWTVTTRFGLTDGSCAAVLPEPNQRQIALVPDGPAP